MAQINLEFNTSGNDALKKLQQEVTALKAELDKLQGSTEKTGKAESGLAAYRREQIKEMRNYRFVVGEMRDAIGGASIALSLLSLNSGESNSNIKSLSNSVNAGFAAFSGADAVVGALGTRIGALAGPMGIAISLAFALAGAFASMASESKKTEERIQQLDLEIATLKNDLGQLSDGDYLDKLNENFAEQATKLENLKQVQVSYLQTLWNFINGNYTAAVATKGTTEEIKNQEKVTAEAQKKAQDANDKIIDSELKVLSIKRDAAKLLNLNESQRLQNATTDAAVQIKLKYDTAVKNLKIDEQQALDTEKNEKVKAQIRAKYKQLIDAEELKRAEDTTALAKKELEEQRNKMKAITELKIGQMKDGISKEVAILNEQEKEELVRTEKIEGAKALIQEKYRRLRAKAIKEAELKEFKDSMQIITDSLSKVAGLVNQYSSQRSNQIIDGIEREKDAQTSQIDAELEGQNISEERREELLKKRKAIETEFNNQIKEEKLKAWQAEKEAKIAMAIIDTAAAVVKALPNIPLSIIAGAMGAAQIAIIQSQEPPRFHTGGVIGQTPLRSDERLIIGQVGETIRTKKQEAELRAGSGGVNVVVNVNAPVDKIQYVKQALEEGLRQTNLSISEYAVNQRSSIAL